MDYPSPIVNDLMGSNLLKNTKYTFNRLIAYL